MATDEDNQPLDELIQDYLLDPQAPHEQLAEILARDPAARKRLVELSLLDAHLSRVCTAARQDRLPAAPRLLWRHRLLRPLVAAAVLLVGLALFLYLAPSDKRPFEVLAGELEVVEQTGEGGVEFTVAGKRKAEMELADGSQVELIPGSHAVVKTRPEPQVRTRVDLKQGHGLFRVTKGERQFEVGTPVGHVTVLGTEFSVTCKGRARKPKVIVQVRSGRVEFTSRGKTCALQAGDRRVFRQGGKHRKIRRGDLEAVDLDAFALVLDNKRRRTLEMAEDVDIIGDDGPRTLMDLQPGVAVELTMGPENRVTRVRLLQPRLNAVLLAINAADRTLTLQEDSKAGNSIPESFYVPANADLRVGDQPLQLEDLRPGLKARVRLSEDWSSVRRIVVTRQSWER